MFRTRFQSCGLAALMAAAAGIPAPASERGADANACPISAGEPVITIWTNAKTGFDGPPPTAIAARPTTHSAEPGGAATIAVATAESEVGTTYQWFKDIRAIPGADGPVLILAEISADDAGVYDVLVSADEETLSRPVVIGVSLPAGVHRSGSVTAAPERTNPSEASPCSADEYVLTGRAGTISAKPGHVARLAFIDANSQLLQVEISGPGSVTVVVEPPTTAGPPEPTTNLATVVLCGADPATRFTIGSIDDANCAGKAWQSANYASWADVVLASASATRSGTVVVRDISTGSNFVPELYFDSGGSIAVRLDSASQASAPPYANRRTDRRDPSGVGIPESSTRVVALRSRK